MKTFVQIGLLACLGFSWLRSEALDSETHWAKWAETFVFQPSETKAPVQSSGPWLVYSFPPIGVFSNSKNGVLVIRSNDFECVRLPNGELRFRFPNQREGKWDPRTRQLAMPPGVGDPFPDFELARVGGGKVSSAELLGKVYLVDFFASWCGPCRRYMPENQALFEKYKRKGLQVFGINIEGNEALAKKTAAELNVTFPILMAEPGSSGGYNWESKQIASLQITGIPRYYLVDQKGVILDAGIVFQNTALLEKTLAKR